MDEVLQRTVLRSGGQMNPAWHFASEKSCSSAQCTSCREMHESEPNKTKGGGLENSGEGKHTIEPLPKTVLDPPPMIRSPPPICSRHVIVFGGNGHRPDKSHFLRPPKVVLEGALYGTFPPKKSHDAFCPPPPYQRFPK